MYTKEEALQYIQENDVKFIKLFFTDIFGAIKSIAIQPTEVARAFETGISFDAAAVRGFASGGKDLFIVPDPATLCVLPWRPQNGRVVRFYCTIRYADGTAFESDTRHLLKTTVERLAEKGYDCKIGTECEFYLFKLDDQGRPTEEPHDRAGYCDLAPRDKGENVRREICLTLEQMGVQPESSHHEKGPGQNEVDFRRSATLNAADNLTTFKTVVRTVADRYGLFASFSPKPLRDEAGSGLYINIALSKNEKNLLAEKDLSPEARAFIAGILFRIREITAFLNPLNQAYSGAFWHGQSYERLAWKGAPREIAWTRGQYNQLIRVPEPTENGAYLKLRSPDAACNQYLALALILSAGLEGIEQNRLLAEPKNADSPEWSGEVFAGWGKPDFDSLPHSFEEAEKLAKESDFVKAVLPQTMIDAFFEPKANGPKFEEV